MGKTKQQEVGQDAEAIACQYLIEKGLSLVTANYRCKLGEIDLIMRDQHYLVFIEVRFRSYKSFGSSSETVTYFKQRKLLRTAHYYLQQNRLTDKLPCRFDVIAILAKAPAPSIEWIQNAFSA